MSGIFCVVINFQVVEMVLLIYYLRSIMNVVAVHSWQKQTRILI